MGVGERSVFSMDALLKTDITTSSQRGGDVVQPRRRARTTFPPTSVRCMESEFRVNKYPDIRRREAIAVQIGVPEHRVQVWFQNRRARSNKRRKSAEQQEPEKRCRREPTDDLVKVNNKTVKRSASTTTRKPVASLNLTDAVPISHQPNQVSPINPTYNPYQSAAAINWCPSAYNYQPIKSPKTRTNQQGHSDVDSFLTGMFRFSAPQRDKVSNSGTRRQEVAKEWNFVGTREQEVTKVWNSEGTRPQEVAKKPYIMTVPAKKSTDCSVTELQITEKRSSDCVKLSADKPSVTSVSYEEEDSGFVFDSSSDSL